MRASRCRLQQLVRLSQTRVKQPPFRSTGIIPYRSLSSVSPVAAASQSRHAWIDDTSRIYKSWSDNAFVATTHSNEQSNLLVINPATQETVGIVPETTQDELQAVMVKAAAAARDWSLVPVSQRQRVMLRYQSLLREHLDELAALVTLENGKTLTDARGDVIRGIEVVEAACNVAPYLVGDSLMGMASNGAMDTVSYKRPLGICAGICPFNFPAMIPLWMFPLAVVTGNVFVLKPSEKTPGCALRLAELCAMAGLPPNVLQIVHGAQNVVHQLCTHPYIKAVSFVGGNAAGEYIHETASRHGKRVQANLGAKNHAVVLTQDYDRDVHDVIAADNDHADDNRSAVVKAICGAAFGAAGQRCMALSTVILVSQSVEAERQWLDALVTHAARLVVGAGMDDGTDIGPLITVASQQRVLSIVDQSVRHGGAELLLDGRSIVVPNYPNGNFVGPTILKLDSTDNVAYQEEIFGPVLTVLSATSLDDAIAMVNANKYGNGCALFTRSGAAARKFTADIECGQVGINVPIPVPLPMFSFTGNKASIRGDLNFYGRAGVQFYTQMQTVTSHWPFATGTDLGGVSMPTVETSK